MPIDTLTTLARYAHDVAWSGWMQYMFRQGTQNADGSWTMPADKVTRWRRQSTTAFDDLPESERASDYEQAGKIIALLPVDEPEVSVDAVYAERNQAATLAAALAVVAGGDAGWAKDDDAPDWPVLIIDLPVENGGGQISFHIPAQQATQFDIGPYEGVWDGHTTSEKIKRIVEYLDDVAGAQVPRMRNE